MRLRERKDRRPGRYREGNPDDDDWSTKPKLPVRRVEYNPDLPKAAFPTVPLGQWAPGRHSEEAETEGMVDETEPPTIQSNGDSENLSNDQNVQRGDLPRRAEILENETNPSTVPPLTWKSWDDIPGQGYDWEEGRTPFLTGSRPGDPLSAIGEDYNGLAEKILRHPDGTRTCRYFIKSSPEDLSWKVLPDGMKLLIVCELARERSIYQAWNFLELSNEDRKYFARVYNRELYLEQAEEPHIEKFTKRITSTILNGGFNTLDEMSDMYEEGLGGANAAKSPTVYYFSKQYIEQGVEFLATFECQKCGYVDRAVDRIKILEGMSATWREMEFNHVDHPDVDEEDNDSDKSEDNGDISDLDLLDSYRARLQSDATPSINQPANNEPPPTSHMLIQKQNSHHPMKDIPRRREHPKKVQIPSTADDVNMPSATVNAQEYGQAFEIAPTAHLSLPESAETIKLASDDKSNYTCKGKHETMKDVQRKKELKSYITSYNDWMTFYERTHSSLLNKNPPRRNAPTFVVNSEGARIDGDNITVTNSGKQDMHIGRGLGSNFRGAGRISRDSLLRQAALNRRNQELIPIDPNIINAQLQSSHIHPSTPGSSASTSLLSTKSATPSDSRTIPQPQVARFRFVQFSPSGIDSSVTSCIQALGDTGLSSTSVGITSNIRSGAEEHTGILTTDSSNHSTTAACGLTTHILPNARDKSMGTKAAISTSRALAKATKSRRPSTMKVSQKKMSQASTSNMRSGVNANAHSLSSQSTSPGFIDDMTCVPNPQPHSPPKPRPGSPGFGSQPMPTIVLGQSTYIDRIRKETDLFISRKGLNKQTSALPGPVSHIFSLPKPASGVVATTTTRQRSTPTTNPRTKAADNKSSSGSDCSILATESFGGSGHMRQKRDRISGVRSSASGSPSTPRVRLLSSIYDSSSDSDTLPPKAVEVKDKPSLVVCLAIGRRIIGQRAAPSDKILVTSSDTISDGGGTSVPTKAVEVKDKPRLVVSLATGRRIMGRPTAPSDKILTTSSYTISDGRGTGVPKKSLPPKKLYQASSTPMDLHSTRVRSESASSFVQGTPDLPNPFERTISAKPANASSDILLTTPTSRESSKMPGANTSSFTQRLQDAKKNSGPRTSSQGKIVRGTTRGASTSTPANGSESHILTSSHNSHQVHLPIITSTMNDSSQIKDHFPSTQYQPGSGRHNTARTSSNQPIPRANPGFPAAPAQYTPSEYHHSSQHSNLAGRDQGNHTRPNMAAPQQPLSQNNPQNDRGRQSAMAGEGSDTGIFIASKLGSLPVPEPLIQKHMIDVFSDPHCMGMIEMLPPDQQIKAFQYATAMKNPLPGCFALQANPPPAVRARLRTLLDATRKMARPPAELVARFSPTCGSATADARPPAELVARLGPTLDAATEAMFFLPNTFYNGHIMSRQNSTPPMPTLRTFRANQNVSAVSPAIKSTAPVNPSQSKQPATDVTSQNSFTTSPAKRDTWVAYPRSPCPTNSTSLAGKVPQPAQGSAVSSSGVSSTAGKQSSLAFILNPSASEATTMGQFVLRQRAAPSNPPLAPIIPQAAIVGQNLGPTKMTVLSGSQSKLVKRYGTPTAAIGWAMNKSESDPQKKLGTPPFILEGKTRLAARKRLDDSRDSSAAPSGSGGSTGKGNSGASRGKKEKRKSSPEENSTDRAERYAKRQMMKDGKSMGTTSTDNMRAEEQL